MSVSRAEAIDEIIDLLKESNPDAVVYDNFRDAFVGTGECNGYGPVAVYDYERCIGILMKEDGMNEEEALDYFSFNVEGLYAGPHTPLILYRHSLLLEA